MRVDGESVSVLLDSGAVAGFAFVCRWCAHITVLK